MSVKMVFTCNECGEEQTINSDMVMVDKIIEDINSHKVTSVWYIFDCEWCGKEENIYIATTY